MQNVNTVELTRVLARDAGSAEALLDGNGARRCTWGELRAAGGACVTIPATGSGRHR
ncbi:MAG: hypothetical protein HS111_12870 [Kofleriaceae bacterium]|nr:hypothetical protein [Kofleriaceae bacterium]